MNLDVKPYFQENANVAPDYNGNGRQFSIVSGAPAGMTIGATSAAGASFGVITYPAPRVVGTYSIAVRCVDCPDANNPNGLGVYTQTFGYAVYGTANSGWAAGWKWDSNTKSVSSLVNATTSATYESQLIPMGNPLQSWRNPNTWNDLTAATDTANGISFNRRYNTPPSFAGGIDVATGKWALIIRNKANPSDRVVFELNLGNVNLEFGQAATANQAPTLPAPTFYTAIVGVNYGNYLPSGTDPDNGPNPLTYSISGTLPPGLTFDPVTRLLSGTPTQAGTFTLVYSCTDGVATTSTPAQVMTVDPAPNVVLARERFYNDNGQFQNIEVQMTNFRAGWTLMMNTYTIGGSVSGPGSIMDSPASASPYTHTRTYAILGNNARNTVYVVRVMNGLSEVIRDWFEVYRSTSVAVYDNVWRQVFPAVSVDTPDKFFGFNFAAVGGGTAPADGKVTIQNGRIKVVRDLNAGGAITEVREYVNGAWTQNYVNNYDLGRQLPITFYSGPHPYNPEPTATYYKPPPPHEFYDMGYNPIETGNWINQSSTIDAYGYDGTTYYIRGRARNFPTANYITGFTFERWMRLVGTNIVRNWYKITWNRGSDSVPSATRYPAENGETPILYGNLAAAWRTAYHNGSGVVTVDQRSVAGNYPATLTGEPWMAAVNDSNRGIGITGPDNWRVQGALHYNYNAGSVGEFSFDALYMTNLITTNMNPTGTQYFMFDVVVGTVDEIRSAASLHPVATPANNLPNWSFANGHQGWVAFNGLLNTEANGQGASVIDIQKNNVEFQSRPTLFRAQDMNTIYIKMKNESGTDNLLFGWRKPGQNDGMVAPEIAFTCPRNGQYNTIVFNLNGNANWSGNISLIKIRLNIGNENDVSGLGQKLSFMSIGRVDPNSI